MNTHDVGPIEEFWRLCRQAGHAWEESADTKYYEPFLLKILRHVTSYPDLRSEFAQCFIDIVHDTTPAIWEIVMYCMRELQWSEVYDAADHEYHSNQDLRVQAVMEDILAVYEDEWENSDLFEYYSQTSFGKNQ